ncbi:PREDICTED: tyrosine-protein kinase BAZ1B-like isoform X2 [Priapulus caudatus]|uniref:Tyrosine-protein kinase BAZ1B-like isoform X2 n=1 Tax=Priapulus caudatus TaxID=37621 RepID=A0ABM1F979_PRICU|nr:PREDICTED: tyrosine-protein kinase BAZ1B-like isoform X2 [Priapulus caudatus]
MPLLGKKLFVLKKTSSPKDDSKVVYVIQHTNEKFASEKEFNERVKLYNDKIWTCQCTGRVNLTHKQAMESEAAARLVLKESFSPVFEKPVLELSHHSTSSLDTLVDTCSDALYALFVVGEEVSFKVQMTEAVIQGRIVQALPNRGGTASQKSAENGSNSSSPASDKENSDHTYGKSSLNSPSKKGAAKLLMAYHYNVQLRDKIISGVPASELSRIEKVPNKDTIRLFIRANAVRFGTSAKAPWVVEEKLVKKYGIPGKFADFLVSPSKMAELGDKSVALSKAKANAKTTDGSKKQPKKRLNMGKGVTKTRVKANNKASSPIKYSSMKKVSVSINRVALVPRKSPAKKSQTSAGKSPEKTAKKLGTPVKSPKKNEKSPSKKLVKKVASTVSKAKAKNKKKPGKQVKEKQKENERKRKSVAKGKASPSKKSATESTKLKSAEQKGKSGSSSKKMKQMTLLDMKMKPGNKTPTSSPSKPAAPRTPSIVVRLKRAMKESKNKDDKQSKAKVTKLLTQCTKELKENQMKILPEDIRANIQRQINILSLRERLKNMSQEEKRDYFKSKQKEKRDERRELDKKFDDKELANLEPLPMPKLVQTPDGLPNDLFGDVAMVTEFLNCYAGLLMPDDPYPIHSDALMKALVAGPEGFGYLSRILVILLQTLLQDQIADGYKELKLALSEIPLNMCTASELARLCLRCHNSNDDASDDSDDTDEETDVPLHMVELLEDKEFHSLEAEQKLQLLVALCNRIMSSYSVINYMEEKQQAAHELWQQKYTDRLEQKQERIKLNQKNMEQASKEGNVQNSANGTSPTDEQKEAKTPEEESADTKSKEKPNGKKDKVDKGLTLKHFYGANDVTELKEAAKDTEGPDDNPEDLASVVRRRRVLAQNQKLEKERREMELKEREKEYQADKKERAKKKAFEDVTGLAKLVMRRKPVGTDRNHNRYWIFNMSLPGLYIEKGWVQDYINYTINKEDRQEADEEDSENLESTSSKVIPIYSVETSTPATSQNLWFVYDTQKEIDVLIEHLTNKGLRESKLKRDLTNKYDELIKVISVGKRQPTVLRDSDGDRELLEAFRQELLETEVKVSQGGLGGVPNTEKWEEELCAATSLKDLGACLIKCQKSILPKFVTWKFQSTKSENLTKEEQDEGELNDSLEKQKDVEMKTNGKNRWQEEVENCTTLSRLHVLLGIVDASIKWEKSAKNANCKICRKKTDATEILLCDECNHGYHIYCLRPALSKIPKGDWLCPACVPISQRACSRRVINYNESSGTLDNDSSEDDNDSDYQDHDDHCQECGEDEGELVPCATCSSAYHKECHDPPLRNTPRYRWRCSACVSGQSKRKSKAAKRKMAAQRRTEKEDQTKKSSRTSSDSVPLKTSIAKLETSRRTKGQGKSIEKSEEVIPESRASRLERRRKLSLEDKDELPQTRQSRALRRKQSSEDEEEVELPLSRRSRSSRGQKQSPAENLEEEIAISRTSRTTRGSKLSFEDGKIDTPSSSITKVASDKEDMTPRKILRPRKEQVTEETGPHSPRGRSSRSLKKNEVETEESEDTASTPVRSSTGQSTEGTTSRSRKRQRSDAVCNGNANSEDHAPAAKQLRSRESMDANRQQVCADLLASVFSKRYSWPFTKPADLPSRSKSNSLVRKLMTLQEVKQQLNDGTYSKPEEFFKDVTLVCDNLARYFEGEDGEQLICITKTRKFFMDQVRQCFPTSTFLKSCM